MSNKIQLQINNTVLSTALDTIHDLPQVDDVKYGKYVWKKYSPSYKKTVEVTGRTYLIHPNSGYSMYVDAPYYDNLTSEFFDGFTAVANPGADTSNMKYLKFHITNDKAGYPLKVTFYLDADFSTRSDVKYMRYDPETGKFFYPEGDSFPYSTGVQLTFTGTKTYSYMADGDFISHVVADNKSRYPSNGVQDGYRYESVEHVANNGIFIKESDTDGYPTDVLIRHSKLSEGFMRTYANYTNTIFQRVKTMTIDADIIGVNAFSYTFTFRRRELLRIKIKAEEVKNNAFSELNSSNQGSGGAAVWIYRNCITMGGIESYLAPFANASNTKLYCEVLARPSGWGSYWNAGNSIMWGVSEETFDNMPDYL